MTPELRERQTVQLGDKHTPPLIPQPMVDLIHRENIGANTLKAFSHIGVSSLCGWKAK